MCDLLRQVSIHTIACPATECDCFVFYPFSKAANRDRRATLKVQLSCYDVCYDIVICDLKVGLRYVKTLQDWCEAARPIVHGIRRSAAISINIVIQHPTLTCDRRIHSFMLGFMSIHVAFMTVNLNLYVLRVFLDRIQ